jgi:uncharacterized repeat protein (TIGR01451 family)
MFNSISFYHTRRSVFSLALVLFVAAALPFFFVRVLEAKPAQPLLGIALSHDPPLVNPGATVRYTIFISNAGDQPSTGLVVTATIPTYTTFFSASFTSGVTGTLIPPVPITGPTFVVWNVGSPLAAGSGMTLVMTVTVDFPLDHMTLLLNQAEFRDDGGRNGSVPDAIFVVSNPNFTASSKSATPPSGSTVRIGDLITYTITLSNSGSMNATGVVISDGLPAFTNFVTGSTGFITTSAGVLWNIGNLPVTSTVVVVTFTVQVAAGAPNGSLITNTAFISSNQPVIRTTNPVTHIVIAPTLNIVKSATPPHGSTVNPSDFIVYTMLVSNTGSLTATNVIVTDVVPINTTFITGSTGVIVNLPTLQWNIGNLPPTTTVTVSFTVQVTSTIANDTILTNTAFISSIQTPIAASNVVTHVAQPIPPPSLVTFKTATPPSGSDVFTGTTIAYTVTVINTGTAPAPNVVIADSVPANTSYVGGSLTCSLGTSVVSLPNLSCTGITLTANSTATMAFRVTVNANLINYTLINNVAAVSSNQTPSQQSNTTVHRVIVPELCVFKESLANAPSAGPGPCPGPYRVFVPLLTSNNSSSSVVSTAPTTTTFWYNLIVRNSGGLTLTGVVLTDTLPPSLTIVSGPIVTGTGSVVVNGNSFTVTIGTLNPGQWTQVAMQVRLTTPLMCGITASVTNTAFARSNEISAGSSSTTTTNFAFACHPKSIKVDPSNNRVWVASRDSNQVIVYDSNLSALQVIPVGRAPWGIAILPGRFAYVTNFGSYTSPPITGHVPSITIIDISSPTYTVVATITLPLTSAPAHIAANLTTGKVYAADYGGNRLIVIDANAGNAVSYISTNVSGASGTFGVTVNANFDRVYATMRSGKVFVINGATNSIVETIDTSGGGDPSFFPFAAAVNHANNQLYVTYATSSPGAPNLVAVYDSLPTGSGGITDIAVGTGAENLGVNTPRNCVYTTNSASDTISVINGNTHAVINTLSGFTDPFGIDVNPAVNSIYVGNRSSNLVSRVTDVCP